MPLAIVRAPQAAVVMLLGSVRDATVGPTSADGWTAVWCESIAPLASLGRLIAVDEVYESVRLQVDIAGSSTTWVWPRDQEVPEQDVEAAAGMLCRALESSAPVPEVARTLSAGLEGFGDLIAALEEAFDLPEVDESAPHRAITIFRGDPTMARMAARLAGRSLGPVGLASIGDGWTALMSSNPADHWAHLAAVVAEGSTRRTVTLSLWRGEGNVAGAALAKPDVRVAWNTGWWTPPAVVQEKRDEAARALARRIGAGIDLPALEALLLADRRGDDPLTELASLLGLPRAAVALLDSHPDAPRVEWVEPLPLWRACWEAIKAASAVVPERPRWLQVTIASIAGVIGLAMVAMTALGIATLASDGAAVEQVGIGTGDWLATFLFARLSLVCLWLARHQIKHITRRRR